MWYLYIFQQPNSFDLFKGHEPASPGRVYELSYNGGGGVGGSLSGG